MAQVTLRVRMDEDVTRRFDDFCARVGMNSSVAVNVFAKTVIREQRIPFDIAAEYVSAYPSDVLSSERSIQNDLLRAKQERKNGAVYLSADEVLRNIDDAIERSAGLEAL